MSPEHLAHTINRSLHRLPLVLEVLEEIDDADSPYPGDQEMRHGAVQAVATMVHHLRRIEPVPATSSHRSDAEMVAREWLRGKLPEKLLPGELLQELSTILHQLVPGNRQNPS